MEGMQYVTCLETCTAPFRFRDMLKDPDMMGAVPTELHCGSDAYTVLGTAGVYFFVNRQSRYFWQTTTLAVADEERMKTNLLADYPDLKCIDGVERAVVAYGTLPYVPPEAMVLRTCMFSAGVSPRITERWRQYFWETRGQSCVLEDGYFELRAGSLCELKKMYADMMNNFDEKIMYKLSLQMDVCI